MQILGKFLVLSTYLERVDGDEGDTASWLVGCQGFAKYIAFDLN